MIKKQRGFVSAVLIFLAGANILAWVVVLDLNNPRLLEVSFFDVGQGDAVLIETPQGYQILIDGGPSSVILEKLEEEMPFWDRTIDLIVLTHPEYDHMAGLIEVLKSYKVDAVLWTGVKRETAEYNQWLALLEKERAIITIARAGQRIIGPEIIVEILHPFENLEGEQIKDSNNTSIIARLIWGETSFLFTGDAYKSVENKLAEREVYLDSDVLKIGHHGSKTSTSEEFIKKVSPELAVIQCGRDNSYGHPHQETLAVLEEFDIKILRTDQDGNVKIISDGVDYKIKN